MNYNIGSLLQWSPIGIGEVVSFSTEASPVRAVEFDYFATEDVTVVAASAEWSIPIAMGAGLNHVRFVTDCDVGVTFLGHPDATVTIRTRTETQVIDDDGEVSFTSIEPRQVQPSDEVARMMNIMRLNQMRRDQQLAAELAARDARIEELIERSEKSRAPSLEERQQAAAEARAASADAPAPEDASDD